MINRKTLLAEVRSQEKLQELKDGVFLDSLDEADDFYVDDQRSNYEEYLRKQAQQF